AFPSGEIKSDRESWKARQGRPGNIPFPRPVTSRCQRHSRAAGAGAQRGDQAVRRASFRRADGRCGKAAGLFASEGDGLRKDGRYARVLEARGRAAVLSVLLGAVKGRVGGTQQFVLLLLDGGAGGGVRPDRREAE